MPQIEELKQNDVNKFMKKLGFTLWSIISGIETLFWILLWDFINLQQKQLIDRLIIKNS